MNEWSRKDVCYLQGTPLPGSSRSRSYLLRTHRTESSPCCATSSTRSS